MKNKLKLFATFLAVSGIAFADVALSETISVSGFVDMSYSDGEGESTVGIDQVEVDFSIDNGSPVTARINVQYEDGENQTNRRSLCHLRYRSKFQRYVRSIRIQPVF